MGISAEFTLNGSAGSCSELRAELDYFKRAQTYLEK
jgi:hypothetical protein